jgi:hypothetical protein
MVVPAPAGAETALEAVSDLNLRCQCCWSRWAGGNLNEDAPKLDTYLSGRAGILVYESWTFGAEADCDETNQQTGEDFDER